MDNTSNQSQAQTGNPQSAGGTGGASGPNSLQDSNANRALGSSSPAQSLSVQQTGEPLAQQATVSAPGNLHIYFWFLGAGIIIATAMFLLSRLLRESSEEISIEDNTNISEKPKPKKKPAKKSNKKKSAPNQRKKKSKNRQ